MKCNENDQFNWAVAQAYQMNGPAPVIGTFEPNVGDIGQDAEEPHQLRVWHGNNWWPRYEVTPAGANRGPRI